MRKEKAKLLKVVMVFTKPILYQTIARYLLASVMISFGTMKILGMQINTIAGPTSAYAQPLEYLTGVQLSWAFLGYSNWFQVALGLFEFVPACLLLFRRTALLGAFLLLPMTLGVCLVNFGLHLWRNTQLLSLLLLALNIGIIALEYNRIKQIIQILFRRDNKRLYPIAELVVALIFIGYPVFKKATANYGRDTQNILTGDWFNGAPNEFRLTTEYINEQTLPHRTLKIYFGPWHQYSEIDDSANNWDGFKSYTIDESSKTICISDSANKTDKTSGYGHYDLSGTIRYSMSDDGTLRLEQENNDSTIHTWIFKRRIMHANKAN